MCVERSPNMQSTRGTEPNWHFVLFRAFRKPSCWILLESVLFYRCTSPIGLCFLKILTYINQFLLMDSTNDKLINWLIDSLTKPWIYPPTFLSDNCPINHLINCLSDPSIFHKLVNWLMNQFNNELVSDSDDQSIEFCYNLTFARIIDWLVD